MTLRKVIQPLQYRLPYLNDPPITTTRGKGNFSSQRKIFHNNEGCIIIEDNDKTDNSVNFSSSKQIEVSATNNSEPLNQPTHSHQIILLDNQLNERTLFASNRRGF